MSELKQVSMDASLESHDSIVLFIMAHGQQGEHVDTFIFVLDQLVWKWVIKPEGAIL